MSILTTIIEHKKKEVALAMKRLPVSELEKTTPFKVEVRSLKASLLDTAKSGIIAEHKRKSPSKGIINNSADLVSIVKDYDAAGVSAISVLTDSHFFGGSNTDLSTARLTTSLPLLRKDFTIDPYQVFEAKAIGASAILLIAAVLSPQEAYQLAELAHSIGLETLMEFHNASELDRMNEYVDVVGINNRNLNTFEVNLAKSVELASQLPSDCPKVAESGIHTTVDIIYLHLHGFNGFLIGEQFMKSSNPGKACIEFSAEVMKLTRKQ
jgi:indole-3-glycerol phosphate synthase